MDRPERHMSNFVMARWMAQSVDEEAVITFFHTGAS